MGREKVQRPSRPVVTKPSTPDPVPIPSPTPPPKRTHQVQHKQQSQPSSSSIIPQAHASPEAVAGVAQYGNTQKIVHDPKPSPRGTQVTATGQQYTATDRSFSLKEGEYGTLTPTGTVPIRHIEQSPMAMTPTPDPQAGTGGYQPSGVSPTAIAKAVAVQRVQEKMDIIEDGFRNPFGDPTTKRQVGTGAKYDKKEKGKLTYKASWVETEKQRSWTGIDDWEDSPTFGKEITVNWTDRESTPVFNFYHEKVLNPATTPSGQSHTMQGQWTRKGDTVMRADPVHHPSIIQEKQDRNWKKADAKWGRDFFGGEKKKKSKFKIFEHWYKGTGETEFITDTNWGTKTPHSNVKSSKVSSKKWQDEQNAFFSSHASEFDY